ncbi:TPA: hypothetical protein ACGWTM_001742 [Legionella pneumophila]
MNDSEEKKLKDPESTIEINGSLTKSDSSSNRPSISKAWNFEIPLTINPISMANDPETPLWLTQNIENQWRQIGLNPRDFDLEIGQVRLKYDIKNGIYLGGGLEPMKLEPHVINKSLIDVLAMNPSLNSPLLLLKKGLQEQGYDPNKLVVSKIVPLGPSANLNLGIGKNPNIGVSAKIAGVKVVLNYNPSNKDSYEISGQFNLGAGMGFSFGKTDSSDNNNSPTTKTGLKLGLWSVSIKHSTHSPLNEPSVKSHSPNSIEKSLISPLVEIKRDKITPIANVSPAINEKLKQAKSTYKSCPQKLSHFTHSFNQKNQQNTKKLNQIQQNNQSSAILQREKVQNTLFYINQMGTEVRSLCEERKSQAEPLVLEKQQGMVLANFEAMDKGFAMIAQIGAMTNNKTIQTIGMVGQSLISGMLGIGQLTGTMGLAQVTGMAALGPIGMIGGAALSIAGMFMRRSSQGKGLEKALKTISKQIVNMHKAMLEGFGIIIENQQKTIELIERCFKHLDNQLHTIIYQNVDTHNRLDRLLKELKTIAKDLQRLDLKTDLKELEDYKLQKMNLDGLIELNDPQVPSQFMNTINYALLLSETATNSKITHVEERGNDLSGWMHIRHLKTFLPNKECARLDKVPNFIWWQEVAHYYLDLSPNMHTLRIPEAISSRYNKLQNRLEKQGLLCIDFIKTLGKRSTIEQFLYHYQGKLKSVCDEANRNLNNIIQLYGEKAAIKRAEESIQQNSSISNASWPAVLNSITINSQTNAANYPNLHEQLGNLAKEYNKLLSEFQFMLHIIASIMQVKPEHIAKIKSLNEINETFYASTRAVECKKSIMGKELNLHYITGNAVSLFKPTVLTPDEIEQIGKEVHSHSELMIEYIESILTLVALNKIEGGPSELILNNSLFAPPTPQKQLIQLLPITSYSDEELEKTGRELNRLTQLLEPLKTIIKPMVYSPVLVFGGTGSGKSALLNNLMGISYEIVPDESENSKGGYLLKPRNGAKEFFAVGNGLRSKTLYPKFENAPNHSFSYFDLLGSKDNREPEYFFCGAAVADILVHSRDKLKGIMFVVDWGAMRTEKSKLFTEALDTFAEICNGNLDELKDSIILVVTKTERENSSVSKGHILNNLKDILLRERRKDNPDSIVRRRIEVLNLLISAKSICISNLEDNGDSRNSINNKIKTLEEITSNRLNFSYAEQGHQKLKDSLIRTAEIYLHKHEEINNMKEVMEQEKNQKTEGLSQRLERVTSMLTDYQGVFDAVKELITLLKIEDRVLNEFVHKFGTIDTNSKVIIAKHM